MELNKTGNINSTVSSTSSSLSTPSSTSADSLLPSIQLGNGEQGTDVRVRNNRLHCQNCYSNDEGEDRLRVIVLHLPLHLVFILFHLLLLLLNILTPPTPDNILSTPTSDYFINILLFQV